MKAQIDVNVVLTISPEAPPAQGTQENRNST